MAEDNVGVLRDAHRAWNSGDLEALRAYYHEDVVADGHELWLASGRIVGVDGVIAAFSSIMATFERSEVLADEYIERGDSIVVPSRWRGVLAGSDSTIEQRLVAVYRLRDGQVIQIDYFTELESALAAVETQA